MMLNWIGVDWTYIVIIADKMDDEMEISINRWNWVHTQYGVNLSIDRRLLSDYSADGESSLSEI